MVGTNGTNPAWSESLGAFFALYLKLADTDRLLVDELIDSVRHRRRPVIQMPDWSAGLPLRGRLQRLAEFQTDAQISKEIETDQLDTLIARLVGAMHIVRDVMDRYCVSPEDLHDYRLADLRVSQVVSEIRRRYSGRQRPERPNLHADVETPARAPSAPPITATVVVDGQTAKPEPPATNEPTPPVWSCLKCGVTWPKTQPKVCPRGCTEAYASPVEGQQKRQWSPERRERQMATLARRAMERMQSMPKLNPQAMPAAASGDQPQGTPTPPQATPPPAPTTP